MKKPLLLFATIFLQLALSFLIPSLGNAAPAGSKECTSQTVQIEIQNCQLMTEGSYQLNLCSNGRGLLTGPKNFRKSLFVNGDFWVSRQDLIDYDDDTTTTKLIEIDKDINSILASETQFDRRGKIIHQTKCSGLIKN